MRGNTLTDLLKTFSPKELKEFREFLRSGFFNKRSAVVSLYDIIVKYHPDYENEKLTAQNIFKELFQGKKYNDSTLRVLMHYLTELSEKFIVFNKLKNNEPEFSVLLENELCLRKQYKVLEKNINRSEEDLELMDLSAEEYYYFKNRFSNEKIRFLFESNYALYEKILSKPDWENVFRDFTNYYHIKSMQMYLNSITFYRQYNKDFRSQAFTDMIQKITPDNYEDNPVIEIFYNILKMITNTSEESYFFKVKELVQKNKALLNKFDLMGVYIHLNQYCLKKISEGDKKFQKESFEIYKEELKEKTYRMNDGSMAPMFYRSMVKAGLLINELDWVKDFIDEYKPELTKSFRENYYYYCRALYEFHAGNYGSSMELNSKIKYDELYMKLNSKTLQMQLLYETNAQESLIASLESFRHFLAGNKLIPDSIKLQFSNFNKYLHKILLNINKKNKTEAGLLYKTLLKENNVINKDWLLKKASAVRQLGS